MRYTLLILVLLAGSDVPVHAEIRDVVVTSGASLEPGLPPRGSIAAVFCTGLADIEGAVRTATFPLPAELAGVRVWVGGVAAPLVAVVLVPPVKKDDASWAPNLIVGVVFGTGAFLAAAIARFDESGRDYQMSIPAGLPLKLWVFSRHVTLTDTRGLPVDNSGGRIPFEAVAGQDQVFTLNISGRDPQSP
ncbi:MAG: hypothetical protein KIT09_24150 [Bryobacteraceae bacterium]|nr:hypothetical protein [Bryobacteraceae bacterium]